MSARPDLARPSLLRSTCVVVSGLLAVSLTACSDDSSGRESRTAPTATATTAASSSAPTSSPPPAASGPSSGAAVPLEPLDWRTAEHRGQPVELHRVGSGFLGVETRAVASLTASGRMRWRVQGSSDSFVGLVAGGVPVVARASGPTDARARQPHAVQGLDPRTGAVRWSRPASSRYVSAAGDRVVAPTCTGAVDGELGDCTLTAYDARTGAVVWSTPTYAHVELTQVGRGILVVQTFPTGTDPRYVVLDARTGAVRASLGTGPRIVRLVGDRVIDPGRVVLAAGGRCRQRITGYGLDGGVAWRRTLATPRRGSSAGHPRRKPTQPCRQLDGFGIGRDIVLSAGRSSSVVLDGHTGRTEGPPVPRGFLVEAETAGVLVAADAETGTARGFDARTGATRWSYETVTGMWQARQGYVTSNIACDLPQDNRGQCAVVLDARTGRRLLTEPGVPEMFVGPLGDAGPGLLTRIDDSRRYAAAYGFVTLPAL